MHLTTLFSRSFQPTDPPLPVCSSLFGGELPLEILHVQVEPLLLLIERRQLRWFGMPPERLHREVLAARYIARVDQGPDGGILSPQ